LQKKLPGRTENSIKNRFNSILKKEKKKFIKSHGLEDENKMGFEAAITSITKVANGESLDDRFEHVILVKVLQKLRAEAEIEGISLPTEYDSYSVTKEANRPIPEKEISKPQEVGKFSKRIYPKSECSNTGQLTMYPVSHNFSQTAQAASSLLQPSPKSTQKAYQELSNQPSKYQECKSCSPCYLGKRAASTQNAYNFQRDNKPLVQDYNHERQAESQYLSVTLRGLPQVEIKTAEYTPQAMKSQARNSGLYSQNPSRGVLPSFQEIMQLLKPY